MQNNIFYSNPSTLFRILIVCLSSLICYHARTSRRLFRRIPEPLVRHVWQTCLQCPSTYADIWVPHCIWSTHWGLYLKSRHFMNVDCTRCFLSLSLSAPAGRSGHWKCITEVINNTFRHAQWTCSHRTAANANVIQCLVAVHIQYKYF